jgi:NDP-sugar pyrophosphorylase family protein
VRDRPKPLAEVAGRPFLEYLLAQVRRAGIHDVVLCVGHRGELVRAAFGDGSRIGLSIRYSVEEQLLGTAGAVRLAEPSLSGARFLVMNGDSFFDIALAELFAFHAARPAVVSIALAPVPDATRFGTVETDDNGSVLGFAEKRAVGNGYVNAGLYVLERSAFELIPHGTPSSLEHDLFPRLVGSGLYAKRFDAFFVDIGVPEAYEKLRAHPAPLLN